MGLTAAYLFIWIALPQYKTFSSNSMKFNTSLAMFFAGVSLWFKRQNPHRLSPAKRGAGQLAAFLPMVIGAATLFQYLTGTSLGIDELVPWIRRGVAYAKSLPPK